MTDDTKGLIGVVSLAALICVFLLLLAVLTNGCVPFLKDTGSERRGQPERVSGMVPPPPMYCEQAEKEPVPLDAEVWDLQVEHSLETWFILQHQPWPVYVTGWYCVDTSGRGKLYGDPYPLYSIEWQYLLDINRQTTGFRWWPAVNAYGEDVCFCERFQLQIAKD